MSLPFSFKFFKHLTLVLGVNDVDVNFFRLLKSVDAVNCLYKVVELIIDANKYGTVAMVLKVTSTTSNLRFSASATPWLTIGKVS